MLKNVRYHSCLHYLFRVPIQIVSGGSNSKNYESDLINYLNFRDKNSIATYEACINILQDTDAALINAFRYQLCDLRNSQYSHEEMYLRLYGILDAAFMQYGAYKRLRYLLNHPECGKTHNEFNELNLIKLRHKAGAHSMDFSASSPRLSNGSFRLVQAYLTPQGDQITLLDQNNNILEYNLLECLIDFESHTRRCLVELLHHLNTFLIKTEDDKTWFAEYLEEICANLIDYATLDENVSFRSNEMYDLFNELNARDI